MEAEAERFRRLAPVLGFCNACGAVVDEASGKLHEHDCPHLSAERRHPKCSGFHCHASGRIYSRDFGWLCAGHDAEASNTVGT